MTKTIEPKCGLLRLSAIIGPAGLIPVSRSTFYQRIRDGKYPAPVKEASTRISFWKAQDILDLINRIERGEAHE